MADDKQRAKACQERVVSRETSRTDNFGLNHFPRLKYNVRALNNVAFSRQTEGVASQESWLRNRQLQDKLLHLIGSYGYRYLELPILEPTELLLRKSGGDLASQIYSFLDPAGNSVSLRPEFTSSLMQHYLNQDDRPDFPTRWQYAGPVFRYGGPNSGAAGQFTQIGAELIGSTGVLADAELVTLASDLLVALGIDGYTFHLADLQVLNSMLEVAAISDRARSFVAANIPVLRANPGAVESLLEQAMSLHLVGQGQADRNLAPAIAGLDDDQARGVLQGFLRWSGSDLLQLGQRDAGEVVERLLRKLRGSDDRGELEKALRLAAALANVRGEPMAAVQSARETLSSAGADAAALDRLEELLRLLLAQPGLDGHLEVDFGLVRGIAYYNGIVFEVNHPQSPVSLGGGGRYDSLALAFGNPDPVPALGFACNLDALLRLETGPVESNSAVSVGDADSGFLNWPLSVLVAAEDTESRQAALAAARDWRQRGCQARLEVFDGTDSALASETPGRGINHVVTVSRDGSQSVDPPLACP